MRLPFSSLATLTRSPKHSHRAPASCPARPVAERSLARRAVILMMLATSLSGCFRPLYGPETSAGGLSSQLAAVTVPQISGFLGHEIKTQLDFALTGGNALPPKYRLTVAPTESRGGAVVDSTTGQAQTINLVVNAVWSLVEVSSGRQIASGSVQGSATYDRTRERFASIRANRDAEIRAVRMIVDVLRGRIAAALASETP